MCTHTHIYLNCSLKISSGTKASEHTSPAALTCSCFLLLTEILTYKSYSHLLTVFVHRANDTS